MKQYEVIIKIMEQNGGFATLGYLNQQVMQTSEFKWKSKTPFANIRRIVQDARFFFRIKPGLWALLSHKHQLSQDILPTRPVSESQQGILDHSYYQGLLVEVGMMESYETFVPSQDKNKKFLEKTLWEISSQVVFHKFGYEHVTNKAKTIDVCWFNCRKMPYALFEVEHTTDFQNSLVKFVELQDYKVKFFIVADDRRKEAYERKISLSAFSDIQKRVQFMSYENLAKWHEKTAEKTDIENSIML